MDEIVTEFLVESAEGLDQMEQDMMALEHHPGDIELISRIFRCIHTIKGTCGFLGFSTLESVAHVGETLLVDIRDGRKTLTPTVANALLQLVDAIRTMLAEIRQTEADPAHNYHDLVALLDGLHQGTVSEAVHDAPSAPASAPVAPLTPTGATTTPDTMAPPARAAEGDAGESVRVDVGLLERLMTQAGELVLGRNQLMQLRAKYNDPAFATIVQRINHVTSELQEGIMKTRMQPIGNVLNKLPRVVRDLAAQVGKQVSLEIEGKETELDKTILEAIKDPLTHIIRNSVDHGIERPDVRRERGKHPEGRILIRAFHESGKVTVEITDDGGGIAHERVRDKAIANGIITADQAARMSDKELVNLIFAPGFSTAETVSNISGRGVGMDVVKTNILRVGGTVDLNSKSGHGTIITVKIPLTLAIVPALMVEVAGERFAVPQINLLELVRIEASRGGKIEHLYGTPVYRLRGTLLPLVFLDQALRLRATHAPHDATIVVLQSDSTVFGVVVDSVSDTEEIVVKPLAGQIKNLYAFAGNTIQGDGRVALILDVTQIAQHCGLRNQDEDRRTTGRGDDVVATTARMNNFLLYRCGGGAHAYAVPLGHLDRLQQLDPATIESVGDHSVIQYRNGIIPVLASRDLMRGMMGPVTASVSDSIDALICVSGPYTLALVVESIVDIVEAPLPLPPADNTRVIYGTEIIGDRVHELVDLRALLRVEQALISSHPAFASKSVSV